MTKPRYIICLDPGSRLAGLAILEPDYLKCRTRILCACACKTYAKNHGRRAKKMREHALTAMTCIGENIKGAALIIEKPPRVWARQGGRGRRQDHLFALGMSIGPFLESFLGLGGDPDRIHLIPVGKWRAQLKGILSRGPSGWKETAVNLVFGLTGTTQDENVAEAILMGWACTLNANLMA